MTISIQNVSCPKCKEMQKHVKISTYRTPDLSIPILRCFCFKCNTELAGNGIDWQEEQGLQGEPGIIEENWRLSDGKHGEPGIGKPLR